MKLLKVITAGAVLALAGCATDNYYSYSGSPIFQGQGGAANRINGVDIWIMGTPPRKYQVIGYLTDSRPAGPISMAGRDKGLADQVRARGGDALIMHSDQSQYVGTFTTANASAYTTGNVSWAGNAGYWNANTSAFGTGMSMPIYRQNSRYFVIKYVN